MGFPWVFHGFSTPMLVYQQPNGSSMPAAPQLLSWLLCPLWWATSSAAASMRQRCLKFQLMWLARLGWFAYVYIHPIIYHIPSYLYVPCLAYKYVYIHMLCCKHWWNSGLEKNRNQVTSRTSGAAQFWQFSLGALHWVEMWPGELGKEIICGRKSHRPSYQYQMLYQLQEETNVRWKSAGKKSGVWKYQFNLFNFIRRCLQITGSLNTFNMSKDKTARLIFLDLPSTPLHPTVLVQSIVIIKY